MKYRCTTCIIIFLTFLLIQITFAAEYHVSTHASAGGDGSAAAPFQHIQDAASIMKAGDICYIHGGIYRETVKPVNSGSSSAPISFVSYNNDSVFVTGCDLMSGWEEFEPNIYRAPMDWTLGVGCNQAFTNDKMMLEARYPNGTTDLLQPVLASATTHDDKSITFADLTQQAGAWDGAIYWGKHAPNWSVTSGIIGSSSAGELKVTEQLCSWWFSGKGEGCVIGAYAALDTANEFYADGNYLYVYAQSSDALINSKIEAKHRKLAFDCERKSYIHIKNLHVRAATLNFKDSRYCRVEDCSILYPTSATAPGQNFSSWSPSAEGGLFLSGTGNTLLRCEIAYSAHAGVVLAGTGQTVENCYIHDVDWVGGYQAAVSLADGSEHTLLQNTMCNCGRSVIDLRGNTDIQVDILHNHLYNYGYLTDDLGAIYTYMCNGQGSQIAYNWVHDNLSDGLRIGIYLDNLSGNFMVYRNVVWNYRGDAGVRVNLPAYGHEVFNNTLVYTDAVGTHSFDNGKPCPDGQVCEWIEGNNYVTTAPDRRLLDFENFDFRPKTTVMIDKGEIHSPYTDGYVGDAPDLGAYESGGEFWKAGHTWGDAQVSVKKRQTIFPGDFTLEQNYPNPFNSSTTISYSVQKSMDVQLIIYDALGRHVRTLLDKKVESGSHRALWDGVDDSGRQVSSGLYFITLNVESVSKTQKAILVE